MDALEAMVAANYHPNRTLTASATVVSALETLLEELEQRSENVSDADVELEFLELMDLITDCADEVDTAATVLMVERTDPGARAEVDKAVAKTRKAAADASSLLIKYP